MEIRTEILLNGKIIAEKISKYIGESRMADGKSILDEVADTANEAFRHAFQLHKEGKASQADDVANFARRLSEHAREIEDHERVMDERHNVNVSVGTNRPVVGTPPRDNS